MTLLVRFRNVHLREGAWGRLHDFSLDIGRGAFVSLLGPVNSGGTAALMLLAGFCDAEGEVLLNERIIARTPAHRRGIGIAFAKDGLLPARDVAEAVGFPLRARGVRRRARLGRVMEMLDLVGLAGAAGERPERLPQATVRKCLLARALVFAPRLLLLDRLFDGLDSAERAALVGILHRLQARFGLTVIQATDDAAAAMALSDRIAVMAEGRLAQADAPGALYNAPASAAVASRLGEANLLPGVLVGGDEDFCEVRLDCGPVVEATPPADADARSGARVVVMVRPERIALAAAAAEDMGGHAFPAVLRDVRHCGDHLRLALLLGDSAEIVVRRPAAAGLGGLRPGSHAALAWQPGQARAFPLSAPPPTVPSDATGNA